MMCSPIVGCTRSWQPGNHCRLHPSLETPFTVIIDNMMNLELLLWVGQETSNDTLTQMAVSHADKTAENHVRHVNQRQGGNRSSASSMSHLAQDGSTYHAVSYNESTGEVVTRCTVQGYDDDSTWSRGQAWCIYGFTMVHRYTGLDRMLDTARRCADYWLRQTTAKSQQSRHVQTGRQASMQATMHTHEHTY